MEIISYTPEYASEFKSLNIAWLEKYFWVEPHDEEVLSDPNKFIIEPGGAIFFVKENDDILGTVALMKMDDSIFELTKMAVTPAAQGKKIGQQLLKHTINFARSQNWDKLMLYSNRKLENAIYIYFNVSATIRIVLLYWDFDETIFLIDIDGIF